MNHDLESILTEYIGLNSSQLFLGSRLEQDCGITGDDAIELFTAISDKFNIDFSEFDINMYFHGECEFFFSSFFNREQERHRKAFPVTIGHLCDVVEQGKWFKPPQVRKI